MQLNTLTSDRNARQFVKFALVGLGTTVINFGIYGALVLSGVHYLLAAVIAFAIATLNSYTWNRRWTFRAGEHRSSRLAKFTTVQLLGLSVNLLILAALVERFGFEDHQLMAQLIANAFVMATNFTGNKLWTFKS